MPYYPQNNILFIHIPKTGGTNIELELQKNIKQILYSGPTNNLLPDPYNKISLQHQTYLTIYEYREFLSVTFSNIKILTVVRNPYDRIISDLFWYKLINKSTSKEEIYNIIKNVYLNSNNFDNHNIPQYKFITDENENLIPSIKIFKTENLNNENEIINNFLGFKINISNKNGNKDYSAYLDTDIINVINSFYHKDFELFNYEKK